ncbi:HTH-type transcriptional regulator FrlR [Roseibium album]|nr:HTH-type transcriptional regulator FrlR [Roseibium album]
MSAPLLSKASCRTRSGKSTKLIEPVVTDPDLFHSLAREPYRAKAERAIWLQICDRLQCAYENGELMPGLKLPGEIHLAEIFQVSRITMRRALSKLQQEGHLQARKGVGIFVRRRPERYEVESNMRFIDGFKVANERLTSETLSLSRDKVSFDGSKALGIPIGSQVIRLVRRRILDGEPIYLTIKEFPGKRFPEFEPIYKKTMSVTDVYLAHGIERHERFETRITGGFANAQQSEGLKLTPRTPVLEVVAINGDPSGTAVEYNTGCWPLSSVEIAFSGSAVGVTQPRDRPLRQR